MDKITKEHAQELIKTTNGAIFSVVFVKNDGTERAMTCRLGVTKHLKGGVQSYDPKEYDLLTVFDLQKQAYRMIKLETLRQVTVDGQSYEVV